MRHKEGSSDKGKDRSTRSTRQAVSRVAREAWPVVLLVLLFALIQRWAMSTLRLPEEAYRSPVLTLEVARTLGTSLKGWVALVPLLGLLALRRREFAARWADFDQAREVRLFVGFLLALATWAAVTLDHNLFFDQSYDVDRLILVGLAALACWRPAFVIPHVFLFIVLERQFDHPFERQLFARVILENLLLLVAAAVVVRGLTRRREVRSFLFVSLCLLASFYWYPGYVKLVGGWFTYGQLYLGGFASYANGWLGSLSVEQVEGWLKLGAALDMPGRVLTLVGELAALLFFVHARVSRTLLVTWLALHVGIWAFSGVSFLAWIAVDAAFLVLFFRPRRPGLVSTTRGAALGGAALMILSPLWVRPPPVGWFDTRLVYTYRYEAIDDRGERAAFPADATPLGEAWCARDFPFVSRQKTLLVRYGKTNERALADALATLDSPGAVFALEESLGEIYYDEAEARELDRYLAEVGRHWNDRRSARHPLSWAAPPRTCLSPRSPPEPLKEEELTVREIVLYRLTFLFDGRAFREIRRTPVRTIQIPS